MKSVQLDASKYTMQQLGQIYDLRIAQDVQQAAAQEFYDAVDMNDEQVALLQKYLSLVIDAQSEFSQVLKDDHRDLTELHRLNEKTDEAKGEFLSSISLDKNQCALLEKYASKTGIVQKLCMEAIFDGINPLHWHMVKVPAFKEVVKRLREEDYGMTQAGLGESLRVSESCITRMENGKSRPRDMMLQLISVLFDISFDFLKASRDAA